MLRFGKFLKRVCFDMPRDVSHWVRFYSFRNVNVQRDFRVLEQTGVQQMSNFLSKADFEMLDTVAEDLFWSGQIECKGQLTGRIFAQGLVDERLATIVERFRKVAGAYLNTDSPRLELTYFQTSTPQVSVDDVPGGEFHMDDNKPNVKFFVYLCDVDHSNGPFSVVPETHGVSLNKLIRYFMWSVFKRRSDLYVDAELLPKLADSAIRIVGKKGFCFAVDTTAWHKAEAVCSAKRSVFVASFNYG